MVMPIPVPLDHVYLRTCAEYDPELDLPLSIGQISEAVKQIKTKKATGRDYLSPAIMKFGFPMILVTMILSIFDQAFSLADGPISWKVAKLIPIYKGKENKTHPLCYRGIAVHTAICKIYANIIHERLRRLTVVYQILPSTEHGCRSGSSKITAIKELYTYIEKTIESRPFYVCFIDFKKAFDRTNGTLLMHFYSRPK